MAIKLSAKEAAQFVQEAQKSASKNSATPNPSPTGQFYGKYDSLFETSVWSVNEKKYTRYLRKRQARPSAAENPRILHIAQEYAGLLFGKSRDRLKKIEQKYDVKLETTDTVLDQAALVLSPSSPQDEMITGSAKNSKSTIGGTPAASPGTTANSVGSPMDVDGELSNKKIKVIELKIVGGNDLDVPLIVQEFVYAQENYDIPDLGFVQSHLQVLKDISRSTKANITIEKEKMSEKEEAGEMVEKDPALLVQSGDINQAAIQQQQKPARKSFLRIRGPRPCVNLAVEALDTHMLYFKISKEMEAQMLQLNACRQAMLAQMNTV
ncbi:unnamed protein product [Amoebophrya sp. A120]|nr:unnamed protein product [Amoebophrya sp. A120]|eukprot:GSA120T00022575001.1